MSFYSYKDVIEEGDLVLAFVSRGLIRPFNVEKGKVLNTRYGNFEHDRMVGMKYGAQMSGTKNRGFIHLLHPSAELWTLSLPHRTQIVYTPDSAYIVQRLGVTAGLRVIEAGTGSASFTHAFARTVGDAGALFTYEFHEPRYDEARRELDQHGLLARNTLITHRDVCHGGFQVEVPARLGGELAADTVFLDLPAPWTAIPHLAGVVTPTARVGICCFSPCIEQVDKTIEALEAHGWTGIEMAEVAGRRWEARKEMVRSVHDVAKRLRQIQGRKNEGIEGRRRVKVAGTKREHELEPEQLEGPGELEEPEERKREERFNPFGRGIRIREGDPQFTWKEVTRVEPEIKTHTSYLTFAYLVPAKAATTAATTINGAEGEAMEDAAN